MISPKICHCIHPFFRKYAPVSTPSSYCIRYSVIKRYSVIVLYKMHIVQKGKSIWFYRMLIFGEQCLQKAGLWNGQLSCIGTKEISSVGEQRSFNCADKGKRRGPWESRHLTNSKIIQYLLRISEVWVYFWSISNDQKHVNIKVKIYLCTYIYWCIVDKLWFLLQIILWWVD